MKSGRELPKQRKEQIELQSQHVKASQQIINKSRENLMILRV